MMFPLLMVFSVWSSLSDDTVTDFVVELLIDSARHVFVFRSGFVEDPRAPT